MYYLDSHEHVRQALRNFSKDDQSVAFLESLALNMCTAPDTVSDEEAKALEAATSKIAEYSLINLPE